MKKSTEIQGVYTCNGTMIGVGAISNGGGAAAAAVIVAVGVCWRLLPGMS